MKHLRRMQPTLKALAGFRQVRFSRRGSASIRRLHRGQGLVAGLLACAFLSTLSILAEDPLPDVARLQSSPVLRHLKPNPTSKAPETDPERTVAQMYVPEGFRVELVAGEPDLHQPVAFAFDERGRIWVAEAYSYPTKRPAGEGQDKIIILEDRDGDGRFETRKVFAQGLNLVSGFELGYGGVWVGAAPELLFIPDRNHDDIPDGPPQVLLDGFGYQDTHECLNSFLWGPDGWLYGNQGVFNLAHIGKPGASAEQRIELRAGVWRYHPVRHQFEVFAHGGSNPWGLDYDEHGQIFMTHCRSYFGKGCTTHVLQGGHFWNQANANYAPFIIANPPQEYPTFKNYLLASARYDHGAGGAGAPGSDAIYGGHSHVGTMIYQGDNWPDEYRGHLFTHNLGGHQMNHQINERLGSGFNTVHAGKDQFFCSDPRYVAVDLQYGPDGAVYMIDWYDRQHCHNPNTERWDRSNGRLYRMEYSATYQPKKVNLQAASDAELVGMLQHKNAWYARTAQRLLSERVAEGKSLDPVANQSLLANLRNTADPLSRLHALWALHGINALSPELLKTSLSDPDEWHRAWAIQFAAEQASLPSKLLRNLENLGKTERSAIVRLYLASAIQRLPEATAWTLLENLTQHEEDAEDRNIPSLLWTGLALRMPQQLKKAFEVAANSRIPSLADNVEWYAASLGGEALNRAATLLNGPLNPTLKRRLAAVRLAVESRGRLPAPTGWTNIARALYASKDPWVRRQSERVGAVFGDISILPRLRQALADTKGDRDNRRHAFAVLSRAQDAASLPLFLQLLEDDEFRPPVLGLLGRFDSANIPTELIRRFDRLSPEERSSALTTLTSRSGYAIALLDAIAAGTIKRDQLSALTVRQLTTLNQPEIDRRLTSIWGKIQQTPVEKQNQIGRLEKTFNEAPLWAYDSGAGRLHFVKLCSQCHRVGNDGARLGPELTGAGKHGIRYFLENIIDPNAVIGSDFQVTTIETKDGTVLSGLMAGESATSVTLRTLTESVVLNKTDIQHRNTSEKSLMPEGLLESLGAREQIELLKFLTTH